jgi:hypothetical protein
MTDFHRLGHAFALAPGRIPANFDFTFRTALRLAKSRARWRTRSRRHLPSVDQTAALFPMTRNYAGVSDRSAQRIAACLLLSMCPQQIWGSVLRASVGQTHGTSLKPFGAILRQFGNDSWLCQAGTRLWPPFPRSWLPAPRAVTDAVVGHDPQHRVDQRRAVLRPCRLGLRGERGQGLLGPLEADLGGLDALLAGG